MESLLASYASSDEEGESRSRQERLPRKLPEPFSSSSRSSSLFSALPQPKNPKASTGEDGDLESSSSRGKTSPFFSSLPPPKSRVSRQSGTISSNSDPAPPKRVVQIRLPVNPRPGYRDDEDEDDEEERERERRKRKQQMESSAAHNSSVKSLLSAMPAPKSSATLGVLPSSGSGRRSILETESSAAASATVDSSSDHNTSYHEQYQSTSYNNDGKHANYGLNVDQTAENCGAGAENYYAGYGRCEPNASANVDASGYVVCDGSYGGYAGCGDQYGANWAGGCLEATTGLPEVVGAMDGAVKRARRGKNNMPAEIVEVRQDELMKNRPREDQVKLTGIAFGPAYQPASSKGKPSKLHKRKHQITSLYFDMKQKEMELAERRSQGLLTKAETQAKYGW